MGLAIESSVCDDERTGNRRYKLFFDPTTSVKQKHVTSYSGRSYRNPMKEIKVVAEFPLQSQGSNSEWVQTRLRLADEAIQIASKFKSVLQSFEHAKSLKVGTLKFIKPLDATVEKVAIFSKKRQVGEKYLFMKKIKNPKDFIDVNGKVLTTGLKSVIFKRTASVKDSRLRSCDDLSDLSGFQSVKPSDVKMPPYHNDSPPKQSQAETNGRRWTSLTDSREIPCVIFLQELVSFSGISIPALISPARLWGSAPEMEIPRSSSHESNSPSDDPNILEAFIHYFFAQSNGQRAVANLRGMVDAELNYRLAMPVIHSLTQSFGETDGGERAITTVIENHRCNSLCRSLMDMRQLLALAKANLGE